MRDYNELVGKLGCAGEEASHVSHVLTNLINVQSSCDVKQLCPVQSSMEKVCRWLKESEDITFRFTVSQEANVNENGTSEHDSEVLLQLFIHSLFIITFSFVFWERFIHKIWNWNWKYVICYIVFENISCPPPMVEVTLIMVKKLLFVTCILHFIRMC